MVRCYLPAPNLLSNSYHPLLSISYLPLKHYSITTLHTMSSSRNSPAFHSRHYNRSKSSSPPLPSPASSSSDSHESHVSSSSSHSSPHLKPALKQGGLSKQFGTRGGKDRFAHPHRDSVELAHYRMANKSPMLDPQLTNTCDSIILAKQRFDKYPKSQVVVDEATGQVKFGGLSPILDASPPDVRVHFAAKLQLDRLAKDRLWGREVGGHGGDDCGCPIYEVERPRSTRLAEAQEGL